MVFRTYGTGLPEFRALFEKCGRDWTRFWTKVRTIDGKKFPRPQDEEFPVVLKREAESGC
jgi:predicted aminopeptidase